MARGKHPGCHPALDGRRQTQQPDHVGDVGPRPAEFPGKLLVGGAEVTQELLVCRRFLKGVELLAVQVLQQRVPEHGVVGGVPHDGGNLAEAREPGCPPSPFSHDQLVTPRHDLADDYGLEQADFTQARSQLLERLLIKMRPRLTGIRRDRVDRDLPEGRAMNRRRPGPQPETAVDADVGTVHGGRDQRPQASPQSTPAHCHSPTPFGSKPRSASSRAAAR